MCPEDLYKQLFPKENFHDIDIQVDAIYYINLNRAPERKEHFLKQCKKESIPNDKIKRFEAIDGKTYVFSEEQKSMFSNSDFRNEPFAPKIMGNQLSHYSILQEMIKNQYKHILILQDDAILRDGFITHINHLVSNLPDNAEMVNFGFHAHAWYDSFQPWDLSNDDDTSLCKEKINDSVCRLKDDLNPCSLAYLMTLQGAINMVNYFKNNGFLRATDWNFNNYLKEKNIFYFTNNVLTTGNHNFESSIFK